MREGLEKLITPEGMETENVLVGTLQLLKELQMFEKGNSNTFKVLSKILKYELTFGLNYQQIQENLDIVYSQFGKSVDISPFLYIHLLKEKPEGYISAKKRF